MHYRVIETRLVGKQEGKQSRERKTTLANVEISKNEYCEEHLSEFFFFNQVRLFIFNDDSS
jgi:hypothetical protein